MPELLQKLLTHHNQAGSAIVTMYKIGQVNHLVTFVRLDVFPPIEREILCLNFEHACLVYEKCKQDMDAEMVVQ